MTILCPVCAGAMRLEVPRSDVAVQYIALWTFVFGASLVWLVMHLKRNASIRQSVYDCRVLRTRIKNILQNSREVIFGYDLDRQRFDYLSPACFNLTGHTPCEVEQMEWSGLFANVHLDDRGKIRDLIECLRHKPDEREWQGVIEFQFQHIGGQYHFFSLNLHVAYSRSGDAIYCRGSARDITQVHRLEENMRILERKFQDSQKMAGLGLLASGIAHDFNNLMTVVLGNAELALLECGGSDGGTLDEIKKTSLRAAELANQMLVYTGKTTKVVGSVNLTSVVREMTSLLDVSISKKVSIEYCLSEEVPTVRGDVSQIRQVAMNLITNASEAIGDRPGVIAISIHEVLLEQGQIKDIFSDGYVEAGRYVQLEVSDTGSGMTDETMQRIFDPLFTTKVTGRGLGLASLFNAVQRHNGAIRVKSELGLGTIFRIYFPVEQQVELPERASVEVPDHEWSGYGTVIIADDEEAILDITTVLMERLGFRVVTAEDGLKTVEAFNQQPDDITLLLLDVNMPRQNGLEAAMRIRHLHPTVPVLFMSGYPREQVMGRFGDQPRTGFITKPFQTDELTVAVRKVVEENRF